MTLDDRARIRTAVRAIRTLDDAMTIAAHEIDALVPRYLRAYELLLRQDAAATGEEDPETLDRVPEPDAVWTRVPIEALMETEGRSLAAWRAQTLAGLRRTFAELLRNQQAPFALTPYAGTPRCMTLPSTRACPMCQRRMFLHAADDDGNPAYRCTNQACDFALPA